MTGWPSQGVKQKQIKNLLRVFWSINFPHDIFQDWSILSCITNVYADLINSGIVHALFFFSLLLKLEQIPDSQMFVKLHPQHLTLVFSNQASRKKWWHFTKPYHILTSFLINYWTDARQHGIYLFSVITNKELGKIF